MGAGLGAGDPLGIAGSCGNLSVEAGCELGGDEGSAGGNVLGVTFDDAVGGGAALSQDDFNTGVLQLPDAFAGDPRVGVEGGDVDPGDPAIDDGGGAGGGTSGEAARLKGYIDFGTAGCGTGLLQCNNLGVGLAGGSGAAFADDFSVLDHNRADRGVRRRESEGTTSEGEAMLHVACGEAGGRARDSTGLVSRGTGLEVDMNPAGCRLGLALILAAESLGAVGVLDGAGEAKEGDLAYFHAGIEGHGEVGDVTQLQCEVTFPARVDVAGGRVDEEADAAE